MNNNLNWIHIQDQQPEGNSVIVRCQYGYEAYDEFDFTSHYYIGMCVAFPYTISMKELNKQYIENKVPILDYWWIYAKDFPFTSFIKEKPSEIKECEDGK